MTALMKRHRRGNQWSLVAASVLMVSVAACSSNSTSAPASSVTPETSTSLVSSISGAAEVSGTLTMGSQFLQTTLDPLLKSFAQSYPNVTVKLSYAAPDAYPQLIQTELQAGNAPDLLMADGGTGFQTPLLKLAKAGRLQDLSSQRWAAGLSPLAKQLAQLDGRTYGFPPDLAPQLVLYNPDIFKQAGVSIPTTFDALVDTCKVFTAKGFTPFGMAANGTAQPGTLVTMIAANFVYADDRGWNAQRAAKSVTFAASAPWQQTLRAVQQMKDASCFASDAVTVQIPQMIGNFASGKTAMIAVPSPAAAFIAAANPKFALKGFPLPGKTAAQTLVPAGSSTTFAVNAEASNKAAAIAFINWLAEPGPQAIYAKAQSTVTSADASKGNLPAFMEALAPSFKNNNVVPFVNSLWPNSSIFNDLGKGVEAVFAGQGDTSSLLAQLDTAWDRG